MYRIGDHRQPLNWSSNLFADHQWAVFCCYKFEFLECCQFRRYSKYSHGPVGSNAHVTQQGQAANQIL